MTFPTEFRSQSKTVGSSNIKHPVYVFRINLDRATSEKIGPLTNQRDVTVLHPDMHDTSPDRGRTASLQHKNQFHTWIPGALVGENVDINDDGTITAYGQKAVYLKKAFADVENPMLTLINSAPYVTDQVETMSVIATGGAMAAGVATEDFIDN